MITVQDRDLAARDASLFLDASNVAQIHADGISGIIREGLLLAENADFTEMALQGQVAIGRNTQGHVVEILNVIDSATLDVSVPRLNVQDEKINPPAASDLQVSIVSFSPMLAMSTMWALRNTRMEDVSQTSPQGQLLANSEMLKELVLTHAIAEIYGAAAAGNPESMSLAARAVHWKERLSHQIEQTEIEVDLNGDGRPEATRRMNVVILTR